ARVLRGPLERRGPAGRTVPAGPGHHRRRGVGRVGLAGERRAAAGRGPLADGPNRTRRDAGQRRVLAVVALRGVVDRAAALQRGPDQLGAVGGPGPLHAAAYPGGGRGPVEPPPAVGGAPP